MHFRLSVFLVVALAAFFFVKAGTLPGMTLFF